jgi:hypothetical protein
MHCVVSLQLPEELQSQLFSFEIV